MHATYMADPITLTCTVLTDSRVGLTLRIQVSPPPEARPEPTKPFAEDLPEDALVHALLQATMPHLITIFSVSKAWRAGALAAFAQRAEAIVRNVLRPTFEMFGSALLEAGGRRCLSVGRRRRLLLLLLREERLLSLDAGTCDLLWRAAADGHYLDEPVLEELARSVPTLVPTFRLAMLLARVCPLTADESDLHAFADREWHEAQSGTEREADDAFDEPVLEDFPYLAGPFVGKNGRTWRVRQRPDALDGWPVCTATVAKRGAAGKVDNERVVGELRPGQLLEQAGPICQSWASGTSGGYCLRMAIKPDQVLSAELGLGRLRPSEELYVPVRLAYSTGRACTYIEPAHDVDTGWLEVRLAGWEGTAGRWHGIRKRLSNG